MLSTIVYDKNNEEKFNSIYNRYINLIFYIASGFFNNQQDREDAAFETLSKIVLHLDNLGDDETRTKNFIAVVAKNTCIAMKRKQDKLKVVSFEEITETEVSVNNVVVEIDSKISLENYKKALLKLPQNYYEIIYLKFFEDLSNKEISKLLSISEHTCYQRLHRARKALNKIIKEQMQYE